MLANADPYHNFFLNPLPQLKKPFGLRWFSQTTFIRLSLSSPQSVRSSLFNKTIIRIILLIFEALQEERTLVMVTNSLGPVRQMFEWGGGNTAESRVTFRKKGRKIGAVVLISTFKFFKD